MLEMSVINCRFEPWSGQPDYKIASLHTALMTRNQDNVSECSDNWFSETAL
jgi:hypothetical protein